MDPQVNFMQLMHSNLNAYYEHRRGKLFVNPKDAQAAIEAQKKAEIKEIKLKAMHKKRVETLHKKLVDLLQKSSTDVKPRVSESVHRVLSNSAFPSSYRQFLEKHQYSDLFTALYKNPEHFQLFCKRLLDSLCFLARFFR